MEYRADPVLLRGLRPLFDLPLDPEPYVLRIDPVLPRLSEAFELHQRARRRVDILLDAAVAHPPG